MTNTTKDSDLQFPLKDWRFWLIASIAVVYLADTFIQWFIFGSKFESITSALLFLILGYEIYSRLKYKKTYMGKQYSVILSFFLISLLVFLYLPYI